MDRETKKKLEEAAQKDRDFRRVLGEGLPKSFNLAAIYYGWLLCEYGTKWEKYLPIKLR